MHSCKPCNIAWYTEGAINSLLSTISEPTIGSYFQTVLTLSGIAFLCNFVFICISLLNAIIQISLFLLITHLDIKTIRLEIMFSILEIRYSHTAFARCHSIYALTLHQYHITQLYKTTKICLLSYKVYFHGKYTVILMFLVLKLYSLCILVVFINSFKGHIKLIHLVITPYSEKLFIVRIHHLKIIQMYAQYQLLYLSQYIGRYYFPHDLILCGSQFAHLYGEKWSRWGERIIHFNCRSPSSINGKKHN